MMRDIQTAPALVLLYALMAAPSGAEAERGTQPDTLNPKLEATHCAAATIYSAELIPESGPEVLELAEPAPTVTVGALKTGRVMVVATGPILGRMDSRQIQLSSECTARGLSIIATITRLAEFTGGLKKNVPWRPKLSLSVSPLRKNTSLEVRWEMRLANGNTVGYAQTPPYPGQHYPIAVVKTITIYP